MRNITLLIDQQYISDNSNLSINIDWKDVQKSVFVAQEIYIQPIVGSVYYKYLIDPLVTQSAVDVDLIENYIAPAQLYWTLYESSNDILYRPTNTTYAKKDTETSNPIGLDELKYIKSELRNKAEFYSERLRTQLCISGSSYPMYLNPTGSVDIYPDRESQVFTGVYFPDSGMSIGKYNYKTDSRK